MSATQAGTSGWGASSHFTLSGRRARTAAMTASRSGAGKPNSRVVTPSCYGTQAMSGVVHINRMDDALWLFG